MIFKELLRAATRQSAFSNSLLCPTCFRSLDQYREHMRQTSRAALGAITLGSSERSAALWRDRSYREGHSIVLHGHNAATKQKLSQAITAKHAEPGYASKVSQSRTRYWQDPTYRAARSWDRDRFVAEAHAVHGERYDYGGVEYYGFRTKISITCKLHGPFVQLPGHHIYFANGCPACAAERTVSRGEVELAEWVGGLGYGVLRNDRAALGGAELDVYLPDRGVAIEYHGLYWHSHAARETAPQRYRHHFKATLADRAGITLLQFYDYEWQQQPYLVQSVIRSKLGMTARVGARKLSPGGLSEAEAEAFFGRNHLQGHRPAASYYALWDGDGPAAALSLCARGAGHELIRFASRAGVTVVGGLSRLLHRARRGGVTRLFTYADRRYSTCGGYLACGFRRTGLTAPGYRYTKGGVVYSRQRFQKHKLRALLPEFDPALSESENMFLAGYRRVWDAGHYTLEREL